MKRATLSVTLIALLALTLTAFAPLSTPVVRAQEPTIVGVALAVNAETGEFSTLIAAVVAADLVDLLNGKRQLTVFAPTDAAFAKLGLNAANIGNLPKKTLTNILLYHVSPGERFSNSVLAANRIRMLNKGFTYPSSNAMGAYINDARILAADIDASNGVIHVIDTVLLP